MCKGVLSKNSFPCYMNLLLKSQQIHVRRYVYIIKPEDERFIPDRYHCQPCCK